MPKISYPFSAVPNQICRGGHGMCNLAVLTVLLSHGKTTASISTLAREIGCDKKSVLPAIRYWLEHGPEYGIEVLSSEKKGCPTIYEINIHEMSEPHPKTGQVAPDTSPENGSGGDPKTGQPPHPKTGHKEEPFKNNPEEDIAPPSATHPSKRTKLDPDEPVSLEQFIANCADDKRRDIQVIGKWAETTLPDNKTRGEWGTFTKRCLRAAGELAPFSDEKLTNAFERLEQAVKEGWLTTYNLNTLLKFVTNTYAQGVPKKQ